MSLAVLTITLLVVGDTTYAQEKTTIPSPEKNCSLCHNPGDVPYDPYAVFSTGVEVMSCQQAYNKGRLALSQENCSLLQRWGRDFCGCGLQPIVNDCSLCEDGSRLQNGLLEGLPSRSCAELEADAIRDDPNICNVWQKTVGTYCGCDNPVASSKVCRLCGDRALPNVTQTIFTVSCGEIEFEANLPDSDCAEFQRIYGTHCCPAEDDSRTGPTAFSKGEKEASIMLSAIFSIFIAIAFISM